MVTETLCGVETSVLHCGTESSKLALDVRTPFRYTIKQRQMETSIETLARQKIKNLEIELYEKVETVRLTHTTAKRKTKLPEP